MKPPAIFAIFLLSFLTTDTLSAQGWAPIHFGLLSRIDHFQAHDLADNGHQMFVWKEAPGDSGFSIRSDSPISTFFTGWADWCEQDPFPYGTVEYLLRSVAKLPGVRDTFLTTYSTTGCWLVAPHMLLSRETTLALADTPQVFFAQPAQAVRVATSSADSQLVLMYNGTLQKSMDRGRTFSALPTPGPISFDDTSAVISMSPHQPSLMFFAKAGGPSPTLFRSTDSGYSWLATFSGVVHAIDYQTDNSHVICLASDSGLFRSSDAGQSWTQVRRGYFTMVASSQHHSDRFHAASEAGELWRSTDAGVTWELYNNTFTRGSIIGLYEPCSTDTLVVCSREGLFKVFQRYTVEVREHRGQLPVSNQLSQNYPNPFNGQTQIAFSIAGVSNVNLAVYDILGQRVATLTNEPRGPGLYQVSFDGSVLPSGVYFYRLSTNQSRLVRKMILHK